MPLLVSVVLALRLAAATPVAPDSATAAQRALLPMTPTAWADTLLTDTAQTADTVHAANAASDTSQGTRRTRAIEYSDAYHTRLKIHQIGAYLMIPLFVGEYILGEKLLTSTNRSNGLKTAHSAVAAGVGVVFVANTVTGVWNLWDARKDPNGRTRRDVHGAIMLASDVGFLLTAASAGDAQRSLAKARTHRTIAISSIALSALGSGMMWLWKN